MELLDHMIILYLTFEEMLAFTTSTQFYILKQCMRFQFLHILNTLCSDFLNNSHPNRHWYLSHCGFDLLSLMTNDVEHLAYLPFVYILRSLQAVLH